MLDEVTILSVDDVIIPDAELLQLMRCTNNEVIRFCDYYNVNIWTFMDLTYSDPLD